MQSSFLIIIKQIKERNFINNNKTPLHITIEKESEKMRELLISKGADITAIDILYQIRYNHF